jgi:GT2 family glycosyltransferase
MKDTIECLESVLQIDYPNIDIIVVDNGSDDDSVRAIHKNFQDITILETGENLGYAGGNNVGIRHSLKNGANYILLLNNDTIIDSRIVREFLKASSFASEGGIFSAKIYFFSEPDKIWYAGARWIREQGRFTHIGFGQTDAGKRFNSMTETAYASGCALFVNCEVIRKIGLIDERFFCYFDETDFCYRARKAGFKSFMVPSAKVWHKISASSGGNGSIFYYYFMVRNILLWAEKHLSLTDKLYLYRRIFKALLTAVLPPSIKLAEAGKVRQRSRNNYTDPFNKAIRLGVLDYLLRRFGNCPKSLSVLRE